MKRLRFREPFSGLSHLGGAALGVPALCVLICMSLGRPWHVTGFSIYGASMILLYSASAIYHLLPLRRRRVQQLLVLDQSAIYLLIAGTYTPICLVPLRGPWGWSLLGVVWGIALAGIGLRVGWRRAPQWISFVLYLLMGWLCLIAISPLLHSLPLAGLGWLALGGALYTLGSVVFATQRPRLWPGRFGSHDLWHLFVLGGSTCHFLVMLWFIAPAR